MIMNERKLSENMVKSLMNQLNTTIEIYKEKLKMKNNKYNEECIQISKNNKILFISSIENIKEVLIKFDNEKALITMNDKSSLIELSKLRVEKSGDYEKNLSIYNDGILFISLNTVNINEEKSSLTSSYVKLIYIFIVYNLFSRQKETVFID